ncbi:MAG: TorF family putative porin [Thioalkalispiraceae bacterium]
MKLKKLNLTAAALAVSVAMGSSLATTESAQAEMSYNIGVHSKYLLRGIFEENTGTAVQGGADYSDGGFYAGWWFSSLSYNYEAPADTKTDVTGFENDFYAGYAGSITDTIGYDVGLIQYVYVNVDDSDLLEATGTMTFGDFYVGLQYLLSDGWWGNAGDIYWKAGWGTEVGGGVNLALDYGYYTYEDDDNSELGTATTSTSGFRHLNVTASKEVMKGVDAYVQYTFAGEDRAGVEYNDSMVAGITYGF